MQTFHLSFFIIIWTYLSLKLIISKYKNFNNHILCYQWIWLSLKKKKKSFSPSFFVSTLLFNSAVHDCLWYEKHLLLSLISFQRMSAWIKRNIQGEVVLPTSLKWNGFRLCWMHKSSENGALFLLFFWENKVKEQM